MLTRNIGLIADPNDVPPSQLSAVAAALQQQVTTDFGPLWNVQATVSPFATVGDMPIGYWPVVIQNQIDPNDPNREGYHTDNNNQPVAFVSFLANWTLAASHEILEILADPYGSSFAAGPSSDPANANNRVQYLLEVCDPVQDARFAYTVNDILVSDFITPHYHDPDGSEGVRYDFRGQVGKPRQVLNGGLLSWQDPALDEWFQLKNFGSPQILSGGSIQQQARGMSAREHIHAALPQTGRLSVPKRRLDALAARAERNEQARSARAKRLEQEFTVQK